MTIKPKGFFITGTDTGVGKTTIACHLLNYLKHQGYKTAALKPIATGAIDCVKIEKNQNNIQVISEDALLLNQAATFKAPLHWVNPFAFQSPIAPHLAANEQKVVLNAQEIYLKCLPILKTPVDFVIIEGAGGLLVPLNEQETLVDLIVKLNFPVIIVILLRLGCLNHELLTYEYLKSRQIPIAGWVSNTIGKRMRAEKENIQTLKNWLPIPYLGHYPLNAFYLNADLLAK